VIFVLTYCTGDIDVHVGLLIVYAKFSDIFGEKNMMLLGLLLVWSFR